MVVAHLHTDLPGLDVYLNNLGDLDVHANPGLPLFRRLQQEVLVVRANTNLIKVKLQTRDFLPIIRKHIHNEVPLTHLIHSELHHRPLRDFPLYNIHLCTFTTSATCFCSKILSRKGSTDNCTVRDLMSRAPPATPSRFFTLILEISSSNYSSGELGRLNDSVYFG